MSKNDKKIKFSEKLSHLFRKRWLLNGAQLVLLIVVLIVAYYCLYLWMDNNNLPEFDITTNKLHTLSDSSKNVLSQIGDKKITILVYGYDESSSLFELLRQYNRANENITYRLINEENDLATVKLYSLSEGYKAIIIKTDDGFEKVIDGSELSTTDYTIGQVVDISEQVITNSILSLVDSHKPVIYFTEGHEEFGASELATVRYLLNNESFILNNVNLEITGTVPDDCNILAIISPQKDFTDEEAEAVKEFIGKGGNIFFALGVVDPDKDISNLQSILGEYGVQLENGYVLEYAENMSPANYPFVFAPQVSSTNKITADIYTDSYLTLLESARLKFKNDSNLQELNVTKDVIVKSSDESTFIDDLKADSVANAALSAQTGSSDIAATMEKVVGKKAAEDGAEEDVMSKLVVCATANFMADAFSQYVSTSYPLSYMGRNKDFVINSMAYLGDKDYTLTIRKDYATNTYLPTDSQNRIVLTVIFSVPLFIIIAGIIIWKYRKRRK